VFNFTECVFVGGLIRSMVPAGYQFQTILLSPAFRKQGTHVTQVKKDLGRGLSIPRERDVGNRSIPRDSSRRNKTSSEDDPVLR
jgi:hypothetical protein